MGPVWIQEDTINVQQSDTCYKSNMIHTYNIYILAHDIHTHTQRYNVCLYNIQYNHTQRIVCAHMCFWVVVVWVVTCVGRHIFMHFPNPITGIELLHSCLYDLSKKKLLAKIYIGKRRVWIELDRDPYGHISSPNSKLKILVQKNYSSFFNGPPRSDLNLIN